MLAYGVHEWGQFLVGVATLIGAGLTSMKWLLKRSETRVAATQTAAINEWFTSKLRENMIRLATQAGPSRTRVIDIAFTDTQIRLSIPVILDQWMALPWGLWVCGVDFALKSTGYLIKCDTTSRLLTHTHEGTEMVHVIQGTMEDLATGKRYEVGETWVIPAQTPHMVHFDAPRDDRSFIAMVVVSPALPDPRQSPINLAGLGRLIDVIPNP